MRTQAHCLLQRRRLKPISPASTAVCNATRLRVAVPTDAPQLARLDAICTSEGSAGWSAGVFESTLQQPHAMVLVAQNDSDEAQVSNASPVSSSAVLAGFAAGIYVGGELQIENLAVAPEARGRSIGTQLVQSMLLKHGISAASPDSSCFLEVKEGNSAAQAMYQKLGFRVVGRRKNFYPDGSAAVLMQLGGEVL